MLILILILMLILIMILIMILMLQASLGLVVDPDAPLFLFMGRLDAQKGVDIMFEAISKVLQAGESMYV